MIARTLTAMVAVFLLFGGWMLIQQAGRRFARRHPEFGRFREEGGECGKTCGCAGWKHCVKKSSEFRGQGSGKSCRGVDSGDKTYLNGNGNLSDPSDRTDHSKHLNPVH